MCCSYFGYDFRNLAADIKDRMDDLFYPIWTYSCTRTCQYCGRATVDLFTEERKPLAKKAKDAAAGAVLIVAIFAAVIGILIFIPKLLDVAGL